MLSKAIFLDRDGVINKWEHPGEGASSEQFYILSWDQFEFCDGALDALKMAKEKLPQYDIFVVSNQSGIGRGWVEEDVIHDIFYKMRRYVLQAGGEIRSYAFCPHEPDTGCWCRKPRPAMLWWAAYNYGLDLGSSWMIGDSVSDMGAAERACIPVKQRIHILTDYNEPVGPSITSFNVFGLYYAMETIEAHERTEA